MEHSAIDNCNSLFNHSLITKPISITKYSILYEGNILLGEEIQPILEYLESHFILKELFLRMNYVLVCINQENKPKKIFLCEKHVFS